jgi:hypothetical protein
VSCHGSMHRLLLMADIFQLLAELIGEFRKADNDEFVLTVRISVSDKRTRPRSTGTSELCLNRHIPY